MLLKLKPFTVEKKSDYWSAACIHGFTLKPLPTKCLTASSIMLWFLQIVFWLMPVTEEESIAVTRGGDDSMNRIVIDQPVLEVNSSGQDFQLNLSVCLAWEKYFFAWLSCWDMSHSFSLWSLPKGPHLHSVPCHHYRKTGLYRSANITILVAWYLSTKWYIESLEQPW